MNRNALDFIDNKRIFIFVGNFGSGKTEVAVNFSLALIKVRPHIAIVDLDIVNPYFRCREARDRMELEGIKVIIPPGEYFWADLPIILPTIRGVVQNLSNTVILDVGGDDVGAKVLSSFADIFEKIPYEFLFVVNANRPFTGDLAGCQKIVREIEESSRMRVTGIVSNTHLMGDTLPETIYRGCTLSQNLAESIGVPLRFASIESSLLNIVEPPKITCPIFPIKRFMLPPWEDGNFQNIMKRK